MEAMKERLRAGIERLRAAREQYLTVKLLHAWILGFLSIGYVAYAAPLALQSLVLVAAKVWLGALIGYFLGEALFEERAAVGHRRTAVVCAAILALSLGV